MTFNKNIEAALFADDTANFAQGVQHRGITTKLRRAHKKMKTYCERWRISLNTEKTEAIIFPFDGKAKLRPPGNVIKLSPKPQEYTNVLDDDGAIAVAANNAASQQSIEIDEEPITYQATVKYLGILLDAKLNFGTHIHNAVTKAKAALAALYPVFEQHSKFEPRTKLLVYRQVILCYGSPIWMTAAASHHKQMQLVQNRALKTILGLRRRHATVDVHSKAGLPMVSEYLHSLNAKFNGRCAS